MGLIFTTVLSLFFTLGCVSTSESYTLTTSQNQTIRLRLAITLQAQMQGVSGIKKDDFGLDEGMLFVYDDTDVRHFWMPNTYFNLDIFFLDQSFKVIDLERNVPHHIGRQDTEKIPRIRPVISQHVLEMRSDSPIAAIIEIGDQLTFKGEKKLEELIKTSH